MYLPLIHYSLSLMGRIVGVILLTRLWVKKNSLSLCLCLLWKTDTCSRFLGRIKWSDQGGLRELRATCQNMSFSLPRGAITTTPIPRKSQPPPFSSCHSVPIRGHNQISQLRFLPMCILTQHTHTLTAKKGNIGSWQCLHHQHDVLQRYVLCVCICQSTRRLQRSHIVNQLR